LPKKAKPKADKRAFCVLDNASLTDAERTTSVNYLRRHMLVCHQNAKRSKRGQKVTVEHWSP
jgi:hypothetical protein